MRWLLVSAMNAIRSLARIAMSCGQLNWPAPAPKVPNFAPFPAPPHVAGLMMWMLYCFVLATQRFPVAGSTA